MTTLRCQHLNRVSLFAVNAYSNLCTVKLVNIKKIHHECRTNHIGTRSLKFWGNIHRWKCFSARLFSFLITFFQFYEVTTFPIVHLTHCCWWQVRACSSPHPWLHVRSLWQRDEASTRTWLCARTPCGSCGWASHKWWHWGSCWSKPWSSWPRRATRGCEGQCGVDRWPRPARWG